MVYAANHMTKRRRNGRNVSIVATICVWFKKHGSKRMIRIALIFFLHLSITYQAALKCNQHLQLATEDILVYGVEGFLQFLRKWTHQRERNHNGIVTIDLIFRTNDDHFNSQKS